MNTLNRYRSIKGLARSPVILPESSAATTNCDILAHFQNHKKKKKKLRNTLKHFDHLDSL